MWVAYCLLKNVDENGKVNLEADIGSMDFPLRFLVKFFDFMRKRYLNNVLAKHGLTNRRFKRP